MRLRRSRRRPGRAGPAPPAGPGTRSVQRPWCSGAAAGRWMRWPTSVLPYETVTVLRSAATVRPWRSPCRRHRDAFRVSHEEYASGVQIRRLADSGGVVSPYRELMHRWTPRRVDLAAAAVLTAGTQAEVWAGLVARPPTVLLAATCLVGTVAAAWHRIAPTAALVVVLTTLAVTPGL